MKLHFSLTALCAALTLSACGGGSDDPVVPPAPPAPVMKLSAANMVAATGVAMTADRRVSGEFAALLNVVIPHYMSQASSGTYPCAKGGNLTLTRGGSSNNLWTFTVNKCVSNSGLNLGSGVLEIDTNGYESAGLGFSIRDITYTGADMSTLVSTLNGKYNFLVPSNETISRSSTGALTLVRLGVTHVYTDHYTEGKKGDDNYLKQGVKVKTPRFEHVLNVVWDKPTNTFTISADDGSTVVATVASNGDAKLEFRTSATGAAVVTSNVTAAELTAARDKAL